MMMCDGEFRELLVGVCRRFDILKTKSLGEAAGS